MEQKQTNPKDALGIKKAPTHLIPTAPLYELGLAMLEGGRKYGAHNFRDAGTRASVYYDAARRHLDAWWEGEDIDGDSGIHHLMKAAACLFVMRDSMFMGNEVDDRPIRYPNGLNLKEFNEQTEKIIDKYPNCKEPFTQKSKTIKCVGTVKPTAFCDCFEMKLPPNDYLVQYCDKCYGIQPVEDQEPEIYRGFKIDRRKEADLFHGWYVVKKSDTSEDVLCLHKNGQYKTSTGYSEYKHDIGEAPGYYHNKAEARYYIDKYYKESK